MLISNEFLKFFFALRNNAQYSCLPRLITKLLYNICLCISTQLQFTAIIVYNYSYSLSAPVILIYSKGLRAYKATKTKSTWVKFRSNEYFKTSKHFKRDLYSEFQSHCHTIMKKITNCLFFFSLTMLRTFLNIINSQFMAK